MNAVQVLCPAKINLFLRILARENSGYHQIETLFQAVGLFDRIEVRKGVTAGIGFELERAESAPGSGDILGDLGDPGRNTVMTAATAFFAATGIEPSVQIVLVKAIPAGTGLGGASSDAAATLIALNRLHGDPLTQGRMLKIAQTIGADVAFFLQQSPAALAWGRGDRLLSLPAVAPHPVVIAIADARISTGAAYGEASARLDLPAKPAVLEGPGAAETGIAGLLPPPPLRGNDFEPAVFERWPHLAEIRDALAEMGAIEARLTGSGSAIFGIFAAPEAAEQAARRIARLSAAPAVLQSFTLDTLPQVDILRDR